MDQIIARRPDWNIQKDDANNKYKWIVKCNDKEYFLCEYINEEVLIIKGFDDDGVGIISSHVLDYDEIENEVMYTCSCFNYHPKRAAIMKSVKKLLECLDIPDLLKVNKFIVDNNFN